MKQPMNILLLVADDHRHDLLGIAGHPDVQTPHLDDLAQQGVRFTHAFDLGSSHAAVCAPSRAMLHTGRSLFRIPNAIKQGDWEVVKYEPQGVDPESVPLLGALLKEAGYYRFGCGKWHNGHRAFTRSFDDGGAVFFGGMTDPFHPPLHAFDALGDYSAQHASKGEQHATDAFADAAVQFLRRHKTKQPFFLSCAFTAPHDPFRTHARWHEIYHPDRLTLPANLLPKHAFDNGALAIRDEMLLPHPRTESAVRRYLADHYAMISHLDDAVGRIIEALTLTGALNRTLVVYTADHGLALGQHGLLGKQNLYDHSIRVPLIMTGPGLPKEHTCGALIYQHDLFSTLLAAAGLPHPAGTEFDLDLRRVATGAQEGRTSLYFTYSNLQRAVRTRRHKLIAYRKDGTVRRQLFDLEQDPLEMDDLSNRPNAAAIMARCQSHLLHHGAWASDPHHEQFQPDPCSSR
jgi:arylsulfatase A-like enzyme